jgi:site-specific recombinase XerD
MRTTKPHVKRWKWGNGTTKWVVDGLRDENGKRVRKFFPARDAANEWLALRRPELKNQGRAAMALTDSQRIDAIRALAILGPYEASLSDAAEAFVARARILEKTVKFAALREEYLKAKLADGKSAQYRCDISHRLSTFGRTFDERQVATIETREVDDWLRGLDQSPTSRRNFRKVLRTAFEFAVSRGYAKDNPIVRTAAVKVAAPVPGILKPKEIAALLASADPKIVPALALAAFAGLRQAEIDRMTWDKIDLAGGHVKIDAVIAKTNSRRIVPISDNLRAWLTPYAKKAGRIRPVVSVAYPLLQSARAKGAEALKNAAEPATNLVEWPQNALRHSFASYRMALVSNAAQVAEECGNSVQVMKTHYRELVSKAEAEAWFAVVPEKPAGNMIHFVPQQAVG